jgi:chemosensory pili system protein ChpA (sensor histidine kinase/response regulator)
MKRKVLLADDEVTVRHMLSRVLQAEGYEVLLAANGEEAIRLLGAAPPDLVLLDLNMPRVDGWEVLRFMHRMELMAPIIVITARPHQQAQASKLGVDALMEKPLDLPVLLEAITNLLSKPAQSRVERQTDSKFTTCFLAHRHGALCC